MFFRVLVSFCIFFVSLLSAPLDTAEAFKLRSSIDEQNVRIDFKFGQDIYIYNQTFEIKLADKPINSLIDMPKTEISNEYEIIPTDFSLLIPLKLIEENLQDDLSKISISYQGCAKNGICYRPQNKTYIVSKVQSGYKVVDSDAKQEISDEQSIANELSSKSFLLSLVTFFGYGLLLALTPCVFPMIPILSSIIVAKGGENLGVKKGFLLSFVYVLAMSFAYALAGVGASALGFGVQGMLQNAWILGTFAVIFVLLAFSMFGFYELKLPSVIENFINKKSKNSSGLLGVFIMGFTSALIVSPCVAAPLAGALLYIAQSGNLLYGGVMLFIMGLGMGVPLLIIGASSGKILPRPGVWMDGVKSLFGFLMLFMSVWLLSRVFGSVFELVGYGVLGVFTAVFFGAFEAAGSGWLKFKKATAILFFVYSVMLIIGGFLGSKNALSPLSGFNLSASAKDELKFEKVQNLQELLAAINNSKKPVMVDFWANWCVSCLELDDRTFSDLGVKNTLKNFTVIKIDVTQNLSQNREMLKYFSLIDPPALLFFKDGLEISSKRIIGYIEPQKFLEKVSDI
ncbi:protein-disulfide reductase DsbD [Campylobacter sp. 7477a]|uniref:protein-disulfide reductase DsbD n=1 Tax=Campylobacter sp. 7477a TaxID=2735741 RepID=UPI003014B701|nr:protein-disulfide reductase DsbD [Campylobacter sp. 7477a]